VCEWRQVGIETTTSEVDAGLVVDAAVRARDVWTS
jgi:hypothetical protein